jgi:hypothetical protein
MMLTTCHRRLVCGLQPARLAPRVALVAYSGYDGSGMGSCTPGGEGSEIWPGEQSSLPLDDELGTDLVDESGFALTG